MEALQKPGKSTKHIFGKIYSYFVKMIHIMYEMSYKSISNLNMGTIIICDPYAEECDPDMCFMA